MVSRGNPPEGKRGTERSGASTAPPWTETTELVYGDEHFLGEETAFPLSCPGHLQCGGEKLRDRGRSEMLEGTQEAPWAENAGAFEWKFELERKPKRKLILRFCEPHYGCLCHRASREWRFQAGLDSLHNRTRRRKNHPQTGEAWEGWKRRKEGRQS